ncbi:sensor histidine kinase [Flavisphingomonas formosensis]|uniref:sensor histidine kinase n=1 Tax=Flavisphingomonas formosensis TaxID=861534 RepID=UPI0012F8B1FA|nr:HAMP domain-containing sensor histidine kinase [Sphingomonas formosensis]
MSGRLSLHARLFLVAALTSLAALAFATFAIGHVLERFVVRGLDQILDAQIHVIDRAVRPDGTIDRARLVTMPGFDRPQSGWIWRVRDPAGEWTSGADLAVEAIRPGHRPWRDADAIQPAEGRTADGQPVHLRRLERPLAGGVLEIVASAPRDLVDRPLREAQGTLLLSLVLLGMALAAASWIQLRFGLKPVRALRDAVARVRSGSAAQLPADQPQELRPLAEEVNALIAQNQAGLEHARRHVANLAHGLKTPLATLALRLQREPVSEQTRALVAELDARIAHHLRRARAAAPSAGQRSSTAVAEVAEDLAQALRHIHAGRSVLLDERVDSACQVAVERQDLEELLGNLLDNGWRHAAGRLRLTAQVDGAMVRISVEDDGPGLSDADVARARQSGVRLDESDVGYGFGLTITQELAELYGGGLALGRSRELGGLAALLTLPVALDRGA